MNAYAQALGLPTYPVNDGMFLKKRTLAEYQWLIDRGIFSWWNHGTIVKKSPEGRYQVYRAHFGDYELDFEADALDALMKIHDIPLHYFRWHPHWIDDNDPVYPLPAYEDTQTSEMLEAILERDPA